MATLVCNIPYLVYQNAICFLVLLVIRCLISILEELGEECETSTPESLAPTSIHSPLSTLSLSRPSFRISTSVLRREFRNLVFSFFVPMVTRKQPKQPVSLPLNRTTTPFVFASLSYTAAATAFIWLSLWVQHLEKQEVAVCSTAHSADAADVG